MMKTAITLESFALGIWIANLRGSNSIRPLVVAQKLKVGRVNKKKQGGSTPSDTLANQSLL